MSSKLTHVKNHLLILLFACTGILAKAENPSCITCNTAPIIICPSNHFACPGTATDPSVTGYATAQPGDENCADPIITYEDEIFSEGPCDGAIEIHRTWIAEYPDTEDEWLRAECTQLIKLKDVEDPVIWECPSNITINLADGCDPTAEWDEPNAMDNCGVTSFTSTHQSGDQFPQGSTTVTYTAVDVCGNQASCSFVVTVIGSCCTEAGLHIECPDNIDGCPGGDTDPSETGYATAYFDDPDCPEPLISYSEVILSEGPCDGAIKIWRSWRAEHPDDPNIHASCNQIIEYRDIDEPSFLSCPDDITITMSSDCEAIAYWDEPEATDNCGIEWVMSNYESGDQFPQGTTEVIYTATDYCGNESSCSFAVTVLGDCCIDAPIIDCPADYLDCPGNSTDPAHTGYATGYSDDPSCPEPLITYDDEILTEGPCDGAIKILRTWRASNPDAPTSYDECTQIIFLVDKTAPEILGCPEDILIETNENSVVVNWNEIIASDDCGTVDFHSSHESGDEFGEGTTTVTYIADDGCGNYDTCRFDITIIVEDAGTLICPDDIVVECQGPDGAVVHWDLPTLETDCGISCGDQSDEIPGYLFMGSLNGSKYYCSREPATWNDAQAHAESYGGYLAVINTQAENDLLSSFLVTQSAFIGLSDQDVEGNFTWVNGDPVTFSKWYPGQPNDYGIGQDCVELLPTGQWNDQYCHKAQEYIMEIPCQDEEIIQISGPDNGSLLPVGTTTISFRAIDGCGNQFTCSFTITVESAVHLICPDDIYLSCGGSENSIYASWPTPELSSCCNLSGTDCVEELEGFIYMGSLNGKSYFCSLYPADWETAQSLSIEAGGHLAIINTEEENTLLSGFLETQAAWIGLSDKDVEGDFHWVDGSAPSYSKWYPGQPNDYGIGQDCVELLSNGLWNDQYCHKHLEFIMEIPCEGSEAGVRQIEGPAPGSGLPVGASTITYVGTDACGNSDTCSFQVFVEKDEYCESYGNNSHHLWIDEIRFGDHVSWTGNDGGYADFSQDCVDLQPGEAFKLMLVPGYANTAYPVYWNIWIDWNEDGDWYDDGEFVAYGSGSTALWGSFTIPADAPSGKKRVRIAMKYGGYPGDPCAIFKYGEVEDYCFHIGEGLDQPQEQSMTRSAVSVVNLGEQLQTLGDKNLEQEVQNAIDEMDAQIVSRATDAEGLRAYPNPASSFLTIDGMKADELLIKSAAGITQKIDYSLQDGGLMSLDISRLTTGIYYVIDPSTGQSVRFMKQ